MVQEQNEISGISRREEEAFLEQTLSVIRANLGNYGQDVGRLRTQIDEMLEHFHDDNPELINLLENTITLHDHMKRALERNEKALSKPYFGRIVYFDKSLGRNESLYIGRGGISRDATTQVVTDWRAPVANAYYENGLGPCSYTAPGGDQVDIELKLKRTYEIEKGKLLDYFDSEVIANDDLLTKYLAKNKQAVLGEIVATIQKEQNEIIRKSPYHNIIVQGVAGSGKTTVAMHRISFILYNYQERFRPDDFYIVGSNRILLNYITGVLPDLDVHGVRQMTMEELFVRLLYEDWDEKKYSIRKSAQNGSRGSIKGGSDWFASLRKYCDKLEWDSILRESIYLNPRQFVEGLKDGKSGVYDETEGKEPAPGEKILLVDGEAVERYVRQNPKISIQSKINMLNERLKGKIKEEFLGKGVKYTERERKAILKAYHNRYGGSYWKGSIYELYRNFLQDQIAAGKDVEVPDREFDVYDLAALAYIYKRIKETEVISEAHHIVIDEAQDFGMMAYSVLHFCIHACTYTIMGDVSQNIHFGFGLNDWEELKTLFLPDEMDSFGILKKSYRNTVEISDFATEILHHGRFFSYPVEPIIRHGDPVKVTECGNKKNLYKKAADICLEWQEKGFETIAVVCRNQDGANRAATELRRYVEIMEHDLEKAVFGSGIMVLPVEYTKGLEFDAVLILNPTRDDYPVDAGHAKLLYVAATRALHELHVLSEGDLTGLIADEAPERAAAEPETVEKDAGQRNTAKAGTSGTDGEQASAKAGISGTGAGTGQNAAEKFGSSGNTSGRPRVKADTSKLIKPTIVVRTKSNGSTVSRPSASVPYASRPSASVVTSVSEASASVSAAAAASSASVSATAGFKASSAKETAHSFGDMPATEQLRPRGHSKINLGVKWVSKQADGLYLQSQYGTLRISPVGSGIIRMTFARGTTLKGNVHPLIAVKKTDGRWKYRDSGRLVELSTGEVTVQIEKASGAVKYLDAKGTSLLSERRQEGRQCDEKGSWLFFDLQKGEQLFAMGPAGQGGLKLRGSARYISTGEGLPFLMSDKGYGILPAASGTVISCDIPAYGSYLYMEGQEQQDYYFIAGKQQQNILNAYAFLCGNL